MSHDQVQKYISEDIDTKRFSPLDNSLGEEKKSPILIRRIKRFLPFLSTKIQIRN